MNEWEGEPEETREEAHAEVRAEGPVSVRAEGSTQSPSLPQRPATGSNMLERAPTDGTDLESLLRALVESAERETSASGKARTLLVASDLHLSLGDLDKAQDAARRAADATPKLATTAAQTRMLHVDEPETAARRLETMARLGEEPTSRTHASLLLSRLLTAQGEAQRAVAVLDHAARSGSSDQRIQLERLLGRLCRREPLSGLGLSAALKEDAEVLSELLGGSRSEVSRPLLDYLRTVRELRAGRLGDALRYLGTSPIEEERKQELASAHLAQKPGGRAEARRLLEQEVNERPTRSVVRTLAARYLEEGERDGLISLLGKPEAETFFAPSEKLLLLALGSRLHLSQVDLSRANLSGLGVSGSDLPEESGSSDGETGPEDAAGPEAFQPTSVAERLLFDALRFHSDTNDRPDLPTSSRRLRLGLRMGRMALVADHATSAQDLDALLAQLTSTPELGEGALATLLGIARSAQTGQRAALAEGLMALPARSRSYLDAVSAALLEGAGRVEAATKGYEKLLTGEPHEPHPGSPQARRLEAGAFARFARRALAELSAESDLVATEPRLDLESASEVLARASSAEEALGALDGREPTLLTIAVDLLRLVCDRGAWMAAREGAVTGDSTQLKGDLPHLQGLFAAAHAIAVAETDPEAATRELLALGTFDPGLRLLGVSLRPRPADDRSQAPSDSSNPLAPPTSQSPDASNQGGGSSAWLGWLEFAQALIAGDPRHALQRLLPAKAAGLSPLTRELEEFLLQWAGDGDGLSRLLLERAKDSPEEAASIYARLSRLEWERGNHGAALLFQRSILELEPDDLSALLFVEDSLFAEGRTDEWRSLSARVRASLEGRAGAERDAGAYRLAAGYVALGRLDLTSARRELAPMMSVDGPPLVALRTFEAEARQQQDDPALLGIAEELLPHAQTDLDRASILLDIAVCQARRGQQDEARDALERAKNLRPRDFVSELLSLHLLGEAPMEQLAEALENLALAASHPQHRARIFRTTAGVWEEAQDAPRAIHCYEQCLELNPDSKTSRARLRALYRDTGQREKLRRLLEDELARAEAEGDRVPMELELAGLLVAQREAPAAKKRLQEVLKQHPNEISLLRAHAEVCAALGEHQDALSSLTSLANRLEPSEERTGVLRSLGRLYEVQFQAWEKAMDTYEAVLRETPEDTATARRLVGIYKRLGLAERATGLLTRLIQQQSTPQEKKHDALYLAELYESLAADPKRASATLERTRRAWPLDAEVLTAVYGFMSRQGQEPGARMLISRAGKDVVRKLEEGRLDPQLLEALARVQRLSGRQEQATLVDAVRVAYLGEDVYLPGAGPRALHPDLEQLLAPEGLAYPLRALLRKTARALDAAFPIDVSSLGARPMTSGRPADRLAAIANALGEPAPELFVTDALGCRAAPLTVQPNRLLIGSGLDDLDDDVIDFLLLRTLKMQQLGGGALSRSRQEDGWPMLVALLHIFAPSFRPAKVDGRKVAQARALVEQGLGRVGYDDDVPTLVLETIGALDRQGQELVDTPRLLATRAATLATSGPGLALRALAESSGKPLPTGGPSRFRFVSGHTEARDVLLFCTTEAFAEARSLLRLGPPTFPAPESGGLLDQDVIAAAEPSALIDLQVLEADEGPLPPPPPRRS